MILQAAQFLLHTTGPQAFSMPATLATREILQAMQHNNNNKKLSEFIS